MENRELCSGVGVGIGVGVGLVSEMCRRSQVCELDTNEIPPDPALPSPENVGREFVRQYYTLLNQSPLHLHRFYSSNSSFIHGGLSDKENCKSKNPSNPNKSGKLEARVASPVMGQKLIHEKIMSLNFRDCHAKIRQVDAHATLDSGVVVQVSGELSNNGGPMRRFMQTFVLAPQSPKKYYVHNDIFRYQDEVFSDEDHEALDPPLCNQSTEEEHHLQQQQQQLIPNIKCRVEDDVKNNITSKQNCSEEVLINGGKVVGKDLPSLPDVTSSTSNIISNNIDAVTNNIRPQQQHKFINKDDLIEERSSTTSEKETIIDRREEELLEGSQSTDTPVNNGPITYAKLVKNGPSAPPSLQGFNSSSSFSSSGSSSGNIPLGHFGKFKGSPHVPSGPINNSSQTSNNNNNSNSSTSEVKDTTNGSIKGGGSMSNNNNSFRGGVGRGSGVVGRNSFNRERYASTREIEDDRPRGSPRLSGSGGLDRSGGGGPVSSSSLSSSSSSGPFSDSQQLFVGNLPHNCSGSDLQALFGKFGKVIEIRINGRGASLAKTNPSGMRVPNYGFVVFEDENSVTECLKKKPIFLPEGNHRLNIEEKKVNKGHMTNVPILSGCRSSLGSNFERGSQDIVGSGNSGRGGSNVSDRGSLRGISRLSGGSGGSRGRSVYSGHQGSNRGNSSGSSGGLGSGQQQQRGGFNRRS